MGCVRNGSFIGIESSALRGKGGMYQFCSLEESLIDNIALEFFMGFCISWRGCLTQEFKGITSSIGQERRLEFINEVSNLWW